MSSAADHPCAVAGNHEEGEERQETTVVDRVDDDDGAECLLWDDIRCKIVENLERFRDNDGWDCYHLPVAPPLTGIVADIADVVYKKWVNKVSSKIKECVDAGKIKRVGLGGLPMKEVLDVYHKFLNREDKHHLKQLLLKTGTNLLHTIQQCEEQGSVFVYDVVRIVAEGVAYAGWYKSNSISSSQTQFIELYDPAGIRGIIRFFSKRIECRCLKRWYQSIPKVYKCASCGAVNDYASRLVCRECTIYMYCCKECQVAHWTEHKKDCRMCEREVLQLETESESESETELEGYSSDSGLQKYSERKLLMGNRKRAQSF